MFFPVYMTHKWYSLYKPLIFRISSYFSSQSYRLKSNYSYLPDFLRCREDNSNNHIQTKEWRISFSLKTWGSIFYCSSYTPTGAVFLVLICFSLNLVITWKRKCFHYTLIDLSFDKKRCINLVAAKETTSLASWSHKQIYLQNRWYYLRNLGNEDIAPKYRLYGNQLAQRC